MADIEQPLLVAATSPPSGVVNESSPLLNSAKSDAIGKFKERRFLNFSFAKEESPSSGVVDVGVDVWDRPWWRLSHAFGFVLGGLTFLVGTLLYYPAMFDAEKGYDQGVAYLGVDTAWLYIIGSCGFLYVDVQEFFTFTDEYWLRLNIACSAFGSALYVIGSAGFLPSLWVLSPLIGILGFIGGSAAIGCSQAWKLYRILSTTAKSSSPILPETINAVCVEGGAMVGGFCFLVGTCIFWHGPIAGDVGCEATCGNYDTVLALWVMGSTTFSFGGLSLAYRHAIMKLA
jgi:hypothetical protein